MDETQNDAVMGEPEVAADMPAEETAEEAETAAPEVSEEADEAAA